jgi:hypothetical protein
LPFPMRDSKRKDAPHWERSPEWTTFVWITISHMFFMVVSYVMRRGSSTIFQRTLKSHFEGHRAARGVWASGRRWHQISHKLDPVRKGVVGPALRAGRAQGVCKSGDREAILAASVTSLRMSCSRPAAERGPYLLFPALSHMQTLFGQRLVTWSIATATAHFLNH